MSSCCHNHNEDKKTTLRLDPILHGSIAIISITLTLPLLGVKSTLLNTFGTTVQTLIGQMWWGMAIGTLSVGIMSLIPRPYFNALLGRATGMGGIIRAAVAGVVFDTCSHGILMIGAKLYERGISLAQVFTFLIASPWNSISTTLILVALIGWKWTGLFIAGSVVIAITSGLIVQALTARKILPQNPHTVEHDPDFNLTAAIKNDLKTVTWNETLLKKILTGGLHEAQMLLRWLLLGIVIAAAIRTFIPTEHFAAWFAPTLTGLGLTLIATTLIEVCSEGSSPIAAELITRANAPGNAFAFLMAGVATDYTEIMVLKDVTKSWKMAFAMPLITVPQTILIGMILNGL